MAPSLLTQLYASLVVLAAGITVAIVLLANARRIANEASAADVPITEAMAEVVSIDRSNIWHAQVTFRLEDGVERSFETEWYPRYAPGDRGRIQYRGLTLLQFQPEQ